MAHLHQSIIRTALATVICAIFLSSARADEVDVIDVVITAGSSNIKGNYRFSVTLKHPDTGWDHYADKWQVVGPDGTIYGTRILAHPHVNEQPFTRSLDRVAIPQNIKKVTIRAGDSLGSTGGKTMTIDVPEL